MPVVPAVVGGVAVVPLVVPAAAELEEALPIVAFARMKPPAPVALAAAPAVVAELSCKHPVTVTVLSSMLLLVDVLGVCAMSAAVVAHAIAADIQTVRFIFPPWRCDRASAIPAQRVRPSSDGRIHVRQNTTKQAQSARRAIRLIAEYGFTAEKWWHASG